MDVLTGEQVHNKSSSGDDVVTIVLETNGKMMKKLSSALVGCVKDF